VDKGERGGACMVTIPLGGWIVRWATALRSFLWLVCQRNREALARRIGQASWRVG
jgi:hypothetical protein